MKALTLFIVLLAAQTGLAQSAKTDLAKAFTSQDRKEMLEALKVKLQPDLRVKPKMVVTKLVMKNGYAFFTGRAKDPDGRDINFRKTAYKEALEEGVFDGDATVALFKKAAGKWKVLSYAIGATDVPYACWWKEFKAPKDIFDYTEECAY